MLSRIRLFLDFLQETCSKSALFQILSLGLLIQENYLILHNVGFVLANGTFTNSSTNLRILLWKPNVACKRSYWVYGTFFCCSVPKGALPISRWKEARHFLGFRNIVQHTVRYAVWCNIGIFLWSQMRKFDNARARQSFSSKLPKKLLQHNCR